MLLYRFFVALSLLLLFNQLNQRNTAHTSNNHPVNRSPHNKPLNTSNQSLTHARTNQQTTNDQSTQSTPLMQQPTNKDTTIAYHSTNQQPTTQNKKKTQHTPKTNKKQITQQKPSTNNQIHQSTNMQPTSCISKPSIKKQPIQQAPN